MILCTLIWLSLFTISHLKNAAKDPDHFDKLSNTHCLIGMSLAIISIYINDETIFSEEVVISWCLGYFCADLVDCVIRKDVMFLVHALIGFSLLYCCYCHFYDLRGGSWGYFVEASTPFLNYWKKSKTKRSFGVFLASFILIRLVYTPIFLKYKLDVNGGLSSNAFAIVASGAFYLLNVVWAFKATGLYLKYDEGKSKSKKNE
uniref:TLC domain-containing protein n=1 Tax=Ditylum brightwellii TaxID=49249 RepID=A0A7S4T056_9STRA